VKIYVATKFPPKPDTYSGDRRFFSILEILCKRHEVTLHLLYIKQLAKEDEPYLRRLEEIGIKKMVFGQDRLWQTMLKHRFDLAFIEFYHEARSLSPVFRLAQPGAPVIVDSVDLHYLREAGAVKLGRISAGQAALNKRAELNAYKQATGVVVLTEEDGVSLRRELAEVKTWLIPNVVPILERRDVPRKPAILFVGNFSHDPNLDGILWFANGIWPEIRRRVANAELLIVGSHPPPEVNALGKMPGVTLTGFVPDTAPYLDRAAVSVAPLRFGAGMKGKVCEAIAAGMPVVTTTVGVQGLAAVSGKHLLVADDPLEFAGHVVGLLNNPGEAWVMGEQGRNLIKGVCAVEVVAAKVEEMLEEADKLRTPGNVYWKRAIFYLQYWLGGPFRIAYEILRRAYHGLRSFEAKARGTGRSVHS
jgi:glycosyltransferase involved in cell wall biosynthesis